MSNSNLRMHQQHVSHIKAADISHAVHPYTSSSTHREAGTYASVAKYFQ